MSRTLINTTWMFDATDTTTIEDALITIEDGVITDISRSTPGDEATQADDTLRFPNATALPGMVDCHVHLPFDASADPVAAVLELSIPEATLQGATNARTLLNQGVTTVRDVSSPHGISLALRDSVARGEIDGPTIRACGSHITITGGHGCGFGLEVDGPHEIRKAVRSQIQAGADLLKIMATGGVYSLRQTPEDVQFTLEELRTAIDTAHDRRLTTAAHAEGEEGIRLALEAGIDTIEHGNHLTPALAQQMRDQGTVLVPTIGAFKSVAASDDLPAPFLRKARELIKASDQAIKYAREFGIKVALGSDIGTAMHLQWADHPTAKEARYLVEMGGFSPEEALRAATLHGAEVVRLADRKGSLEPGKDADIVVVAGNPAKDITALEHPLLVIKQGRVVFQAA